MQVLPLIDPTTQQKNFLSNGYCRPCSSKASAESRQRTHGETAGHGESPVAIVKRQWQTEQLAMSYIPPFPTLNLPEIPRCVCCYASPETEISGKKFCSRCAYYVAASGRCPEHSFREHIPELLGRADAPPLPPRQYPQIDFANRPQLPDLDELDVEPSVKLGA